MARKPKTAVQEPEAPAEAPINGTPVPEMQPQPEVPASETNGTDKRPPRRLYFPVQGGSLCVSIWAKDLKNEYGERTVYSTSIQRSYQKGDGREWTNYLRDSDLPVVAMACHEAYMLIRTLPSQPLNAAPSTEPVPF